MSTKKKTETTTTDGRPVLVTTEHRGVFFGYLAKDADYDREAKHIRLSGMRNCVYWTADVRGFIGLATGGPVKGCRVGPAAREAELHSVTAVLSVEPDAVKRWEEFPW